MAAVAKQLTIKSGALRRNLKDLAYNKADLDKELKRFDSEADEDKKLQLKKVIDECRGMVPYNVNRVKNSANDLSDFLTSQAEELNASADKDTIAAARDLLAQADEAVGES